MGMKIYTNESGHMTNMATMPIYGKNLKKSSSPEPMDRWPWNLICTFFCMWVLPRLFKLWPWVDLDLFYAKVKFGHIGFYMGKSENYLFFRNYCSLRSQSCLKHSAKLVIEVEWVSKIKVIFWPWSKVTQISKLNVWLWPVFSGERFRAMGPLVINVQVQGQYPQQWAPFQVTGLLHPCQISQICRCLYHEGW